MKSTLQKRFLNTSVAFLAILVMFNSYAVTEAYDCYKNWYRYSTCALCGDSSYNSSYKDSCAGKHKRQYGIKLCSTHLSTVSNKAKYYKRAHSDYNCLAYALGKCGVQAWTWPSSWGETGPTLDEFKSYIAGKGYKYTTNSSNATGKKVIYVYVLNGRVKHFARKYNLGGNKVDGAVTISKWGACSLYTTSTTDPYLSTSGYGTLKLTCYK